MGISVRTAIVDLRDSWTAWLSVSLTFVATSTAIGLAGLVAHTRNVAAAARQISSEQSQVMALHAWLNIVLCTLVSIAVIGTSTRLVIASRRGAVARLLLAGATPGQVVRALMTQLAVVTLTCSVIGSVIAAAAQPAVLQLLADDRGYRAPDAAWSLSVLVLCSLYCVSVAMVGGLRQARRATTIPPVEALRTATGAAQASTRTWVVVLRVLGCLTIFGALVLSVVGFRLAADQLGPKSAAQTISQLSFVSLALSGLALALVAP